MFIHKAKSYLYNIMFVHNVLGHETLIIYAYIDHVVCNYRVNYTFINTYICNMYACAYAVIKNIDSM